MAIPGQAAERSAPVRVASPGFDGAGGIVRRRPVEQARPGSSARKRAQSAGRGSSETRANRDELVIADAPCRTGDYRSADFRANGMKKLQSVCLQFGGTRGVLNANGCSTV